VLAEDLVHALSCISTVKDGNVWGTLQLLPS
jgi:hypothetical protein